MDQSDNNEITFVDDSIEDNTSDVFAQTMEDSTLSNENKDRQVGLVDQIMDSTIIQSGSENTEKQVELINQDTNSITIQSITENMVPTFMISSPVRFTVGLPKGKSKANLSKGKRAKTSTEIDGDLLSGLESSRLTSNKILYEKAQTSQQIEKVNRFKTSLIFRIEEMHLKKLFSLHDCVKLFLSELIPISMSVPKLISPEGLSSILKIDVESSFIKKLSESLELQELMRKTMLEAKTLPVCCCGYIIIHPNLCFSKHPSDSTLVAGKITNTDKAILLKKSEIITQLNVMRFFLEMLYEYHIT
jgi:hypothetical protein